MTHTKEIIKLTCATFKRLWTDYRFILPILLFTFGIFLILSLIRGDLGNPLWIAWWAICGTTGVSLSRALHDVWFASLRKKLDEDLAKQETPTWIIYNGDGARIGELSSEQYLWAKFGADTCWRTKLLQVLNAVWMLWALVVKSIYFIPPLIVTILLVLQLTNADVDYSALNLADFMASNSLVHIFVSIYTLVSLTTIFVTGIRSVPGYVNYYNIRLKRIIADDIPNIATATSFSIIGNGRCMSNIRRETSIGSPGLRIVPKKDFEIN